MASCVAKATREPSTRWAKWQLRTCFNWYECKMQKGKCEICKNGSWPWTETVRYGKDYLSDNYTWSRYIGFWSAQFFNIIEPMRIHAWMERKLGSWSFFVKVSFRLWNCSGQRLVTCHLWLFCQVAMHADLKQLNRSGPVDLRKQAYKQLNTDSLDVSSCPWGYQHSTNVAVPLQQCLALRCNWMFFSRTRWAVKPACFFCFFKFPRAGVLRILLCGSFVLLCIATEIWWFSCYHHRNPYASEGVVRVCQGFKTGQNRPKLAYTRDFGGNLKVRQHAGESENSTRTPL